MANLFFILHGVMILGCFTALNQAMLRKKAIYQMGLYMKLYYNFLYGNNFNEAAFCEYNNRKRVVILMEFYQVF